MISEIDLKHLRHCVELEGTALEKGGEPFGPVLASGNHMQHPEFTIAGWMANNLSPEDRSRATVYTSGQHCPMCTVRGWVGLAGQIVQASSSKQLAGWLGELGAAPSPFQNLAIKDAIKDPLVGGLVPELTELVY